MIVRNHWMRLSMIWRIMEILEDVIMNNTLQDLHNSVDDGSFCGYILFGSWRCNSNSTSCSLSTGSPSSKYEHWRTSALLHNIRNMRICMAEKPFIFVSYGSDRSFCHTNPHISNVTRQCRCSPKLIFRAWATCVESRGRSKNYLLVTCS